MKKFENVKKEVINVLSGYESLCSADIAKHLKVNPNYINYVTSQMYWNKQLTRTKQCRTYYYSVLRG